MSRTLNFTDHLLAMGRKYQHAGRDREALYVLGRLARCGAVPSEKAEEAQSRLAEIYLRLRRYRRARRHLTALLVYRPDNAHYHYLMATALVGDVQGDRERAAEHFRRSLALDPNQSHCLRGYGLLALRLGQSEEGLKALYRAVELNPADPEALADLAEGLSQEKRPDEVRRALLAARFRNPRDRRFQQLWQDFQFEVLRHEQEAAGRDEAADADEDAPALLPFIRPEPGALPTRFGRKIIRHDPASPPMPPHISRPAELPEQKHA